MPGILNSLDLGSDYSTVLFHIAFSIFSFSQTMPIKSDKWIRRMAREHEMIVPFSQKQAKAGAISFGLSSYGYDVRLADEFKVFSNSNAVVVDPKSFDDRSLVDVKGDSCVIPPNSSVLARTVEYFKIPRNILAICLGKSTYTRCGIMVNATPFEPEWEGHVTLNICNTTPLPARIYANEGIAQVMFLEADEVCEISYKDKGGKYQAQKNIRLSQ